MNKGLAFSIVFLLGMGNNFAQLNESDTVKFQLRASLTGAYQKGNVEVLNIKSKLDFSYMPHKSWVFKSQNSSLYQAFYSKEADNDIFSRNYFYYNANRRVYPFAIVYVSTNYRRKIISRYFAGAGVTCQLINNPKTVLKLSFSSVYEATNFKASTYNYNKYNGRDKINLWRATLYAGGWSYVFQKHIRFYYDAYWQPAFNYKSNYRTQVDIGADFAVWKGLSFNLLYAYSHENVVVTNIYPDDKMLTFGVAYHFKKQ